MNRGLNRREQALIGAMLIGIVALACDRWVLQDPRAAQADSGRGAPTSAPASQPQSVDFMRLPSPPTGPSEALLTIDDVCSWMRLTIEPDAPNAPDEPASNLPPPPAAFVERFKLRALVLGPSPVALIGRRTMRVGESLAGFTLREITKDGAVFFSDHGERVLLAPPRRGDDFENSTSPSEGEPGVDR